MRSHHYRDPHPAKATQANLVGAVINRAELPPHPNSLLLPERFKRYLLDVYFADFNPANPSGLSRNTASHGVVPDVALNRKGHFSDF